MLHYDEEKPSEEPSSGRPANIDPLSQASFHSPLVTVRSFSDWDALSENEKVMVLNCMGDHEPFDDSGLNPDDFPMIEVTIGSIEDLKDPEKVEFAEKMHNASSFYASNLGDYDDVVAKVGPPKVEITVASLLSGEILGGVIRYDQDGARNDSDGNEYFADRAEAKAAGYGDQRGDANWWGWCMYDNNLNKLTDSGPMCWGGD